MTIHQIEGFKTILWIIYTTIIVIIFCMIVFSCSSGNLSNQEQDDYITQYKAERAF